LIVAFPLFRLSATGLERVELPADLTVLG